jgi:UDPglucose--hexose-1-phosphate uridylyltransferase
MTPPEIVVLGNPGDPSGSPNWTVRVVPNKYPALAPGGSQSYVTDDEEAARAGIGAHEVIVESPDHVTDMARLSDQQFVAIFQAYRHRILDHHAGGKFRYVLIYKNQGIEAGATLEHVHSQLIAMPIVPKLALEEINGAQNYFARKRRCVFCDTIQKEIHARERLVLENPRFIVICPFAPRFPYEIWILPKQHASSFEHNSHEDDVSLAAILRDTLFRLNRHLGSPAFNYFIHSNPIDNTDNSYYHWHLEIIPKLIQVGGFEWGSGSYINTVTPEESARSLRTAVP